MRYQRLCGHLKTTTLSHSWDWLLSLVAPCPVPLLSLHQCKVAGKQIGSCSEVGVWGLRSDGGSVGLTGQTLEQCKILLSPVARVACVCAGPMGEARSTTAHVCSALVGPQRTHSVSASQEIEALRDQELMSRVNKSAKVNRLQNMTAYVKQSTVRREMGYTAPWEFKSWAHFDSDQNAERTY